MIRLTTRMSIPLMGIAFGLFIGCSTLSPSKNNPASNDSFSQSELQQQLNEVSSQLSDDSLNADLYYRKGYLLSELALHKEEVTSREPLYGDMYSSLKKSEQLFRQSGLPSGKQKVDELLKKTWSTEHNQGVEILQADTTINSEKLEKATAHFNHATIILPDTAISYKMKAQALYRNHKYREAVQSLEEARERINTLPPEMLEQLAFLYLESNQPAKAVAVYEEAESFSEDNLNLLHGLANAYINAGNHREAVKLLDLLVENEPQNIIYAQARANQLYHLAAGEVDTLLAENPDPDTADTASSAFDVADSLMSSAENQFREAMSGAPENGEIIQNLAYFYKNAAAKYQQLSPALTGDTKKQANERIRYFLSSAMPLFENLADNNGEDSRFWSNLYQIYTYLGMSEKAEEAKSKIN